MTEPTKSHSPDRRLADIVREVKISAADRTDVVVDMRDADRARLELLAQEVRPLLADIDPEDDRFDFGISSGLQPRLWIDAVAHVRMGRDRRVFLFVRDTRLGRVVISDTSDIKRTADAVGRYIAERVIERERILAGDFEAMKASAASAGLVDDEDHPDRGAGDLAAAETRVSAQENDGEDGTIAATSPDDWAASAETAGSEEASARPVPIASLDEPVEPGQAKSSRGTGFALGASWFILGCVAGSAALVVAFWDRLSAMIN